MTAATLAIRLPAAIRLAKGRQVAILLAGGGVLFLLLNGTFLRPYEPDTGLFRALNDMRHWLEGNQDNLFFAWIAPVRAAIDGLVALATAILDGIGWVGVVAVTTALGRAFGGWRPPSWWPGRWC